MTLSAENEAADAPANPREGASLFGHAAAETLLVERAESSRLPHAWLFTGPRGIGKATLAYRFAYALLSGSIEAGQGLDIDRQLPVVRRAIAGGHPDLMTVEREINENTKRLRTEIIVDGIRRLIRFFELTPAEGGWRIVIIDSADDMNRNAANALLKVLEEPPARSLLILVSHAPGRLLPTIRSRCRRLAFKALADEDVRSVLAGAYPDLPQDQMDMLTWLVDGSPGRGVDLVEHDILQVLSELLRVFSTLPEGDVAGIHAVADKIARRGREAERTMTFDALFSLLERQTRIAASGADVAAVPGLPTLVPGGLSATQLDQWAGLWDNMRDLVNRADALNLDMKQVILRFYSMMAETMGRQAH